jgi:hypothetical protein
MNDSKLVIEKLTKRPDRANAIILFFMFSRFEYALKRGGYVQWTEEAKPDWGRYARDHAALLISISSSEFTDAVALLKDSPPKKQIIRDGHLDWGQDRSVSGFDFARLLCLVRRVRNNLFHGGKVLELDGDRNQKLIDASIAVMDTILASDDSLRKTFMEGLE